MYDRIEEARAFIAARIRYQPTVGLILGSGLSGLADAIEDADVISYDEIPHFPRSTVVGHRGELALGRLAGQTVVVMRGRFHFYEGYSMPETTFPVRVMRALGVDTLLLTNAAGGLRGEWRIGDLMQIRDHINFPGMSGHNPLIGPNDDRLGVRFPAMTDAYDKELAALAHRSAETHDVTLRSGVYAMVTGPSFETPAELGLLRLLGADVVGMSTVPEVIVARHGGMRVLAISLVTNIATPDAPPANHQEVLEAGEAAKDSFGALLLRILADLPEVHRA